MAITFVLIPTNHHLLIQLVLCVSKIEQTVKQLELDRTEHQLRTCSALFQKVLTDPKVRPAN